MKGRSKQKDKLPKKHAPWLFVTALLLFSLFLTYAWGVWYVPTLPVTEVPPYLMGDPSEAEDGCAADSATPVRPEDETATQAVPVLPDSVSLHTRRQGVYNLLVAGRDAAAQNTDVLILVTVDTVSGSAALSQIPRDTFCDGGKVNALFARYRGQAGREGDPSPDARGMEGLTEALESALSVQIDHWLLCDLSAFVGLVDALDGIEVDVPCDMDYEDPAQKLSIHLKKGPALLSGREAEMLVRFRSDYIRGDLGRVEVQKLVLSAIFTRAKEISPLSLPDLCSTLAASVQTSLSPMDVLYFARAARGMQEDRVVMQTLPGTDARAHGTYGAWYYILSRPGVYRIVSTCHNVYETPLAEARFDAGRLLTDGENAVLQALYEKDTDAASTTVSRVLEEGVEVGLIRK